MSVHNGVSTVVSAIRSIQWQTFSDWELLLVNDASTDETGQVVRLIRDPRIRVIDEQQRKGLATRLNQCVGEARGKYVARMDSDDVAYPERFERQVQFLQSHPDIDLLGHGAIVVKGDGEAIGVYPTARSHEDICSRPWWGFPLAHPTWMGKHSWFAGHPYREELTKGQDQDLLLRSFQASRFAALSDILLAYRMDKISVAKSARGRFAYCRQLLAQIRDRPSALMAIKGLSIHGVALARDIILDLTGTMRQDVRRSFGPVDESIANQWRAVWSRLCAEQGHSGSNLTSG
jgi:glycosyltransferase involved in cell wall biosynthesis